MKILKRILFSLLLILCITPMNADAKDVHTTNEGIKVECDYYEKVATVVGYEGEPSAVTIPSEYDDCTVEK